MNFRWEVAQKEAEGIAKLLSKHGVEKGRILDLMCGNGRIAINLAKMGYDVVGVDFSQVYIEDAKKRAVEHGVGGRTRFVCGDVRELDKLLKDEAPFDGVVNVWTAIGYFDEETDEGIFRKAAMLSREGAVLVIASTASRDFILKRFSPRTFEEFGDLVVISENKFDAFRSRLKSVWKFYAKEGKNLKYIDETEMNLRLYSVHELYSLLKKAGWVIKETYKSIATLEPAEATDPINIVAIREKH